MNYITSKDKRLAIISSIIYILCITTITYGMFRNGLIGMRSVYIINMSADLFAMITGFILFMCCVIDVQKSGSDMKYIMYLVNITFLHVFSDAGSWLIEGTPGLEWLNMLDNTLYYVCESLTVFLIWRYMTSLIKLSTPFEHKLDKAVKYGMLVSLAMRILNIFTGIYFVIGDGNIYARGPLFAVSKTYVILVMIAIAYVIMKEREQLALYQVIAYVIFLCVPILIAMTTVMYYGLSLSAAVTMILLLLMYCVHNVAQGREKAAADYDLRLAKAIQENILPRTFLPTGTLMASPVASTSMPRLMPSEPESMMHLTLLPPIC